jgi:TetR/AcrR family transcriptional repressor of nem operon
MRYTPDHKDKTRAKILDSAALAFRRQGYHATGVDKVMEAAGLTAGGFYLHFPSKGELLAQALEHCSASVAGKLERVLEDVSHQQWMEAVVDRYLASSNRDRPEEGCPIPALAPEVGRAGQGPRQAFERMVINLVARLAAHLPADGNDELAIALTALCVGGMTLARAVDDPGYADKILAVCRQFAHDSVAARAPAKAKTRAKRRADRDA